MKTSIGRATTGKSSRRSFLQSAAAASLMGYTLAVKASPVARKLSPRDDPYKPLKRPGPVTFPIENEALMRRVDLKCDVLVAGGGLAGVCAALSAARHGRKTILVQDRSRLGGNASSEIKMHPLGVEPSKTGWREGGIIEELKMENVVRNPQMAWELWDLLLYDKCVSEPNLQLILDTSLCRAELDENAIKVAWARCETTRTVYRIQAGIYIDATGDSRLAMEAGAEVMFGREGTEKFREKHADYDKIGTRQGSSILFTSRLYEKEMPFKAPAWAKKITEKDLQYRKITDAELAFGFWWLELGGEHDAIRDNEHLRFEILSIVLGVWDYIKNSGKFPAAKCRALDTVGMVPGKRDTYRIAGPRVFTEQDILGGWKKLDDGVAVGGWMLDDHPAAGFWASDRPPGQTSKDPKVATKPYNIPLSCLYSKDIRNLMMCGRNISCSHVAFTSTRVMCTCAVVGQAAGTAAALCVESRLTPAQLRDTKQKLIELQQLLLRDDQTILGISNSDPRDHARRSKVTASSAAKGSKPENVISGVTIEAKAEFKNRWAAPVASMPWIRLEWDTAQKVSQVRITFDSGSLGLTQTSRVPRIEKMVRGPQPTIVRDYKLTAVLQDGSETVLANVKENFRKLAVHQFKEVQAKAIRLDIFATNGDELALVKEIRVEA